MLTDSNIKDLILKSNSILMTTHKNPDGDGIGSLAGLYWAVKGLKKNVQFLHVDEIAPRYFFLIENIEKDLFDSVKHNLIVENCDLVIVLDTHQGDLCSPFFDVAIEKNKPVVFVDHHLSQKTNLKNCSYYVDPTAASTGEIVYNIIEKLGVPLTTQIARALYTSLTFDTQAFKLTRNSYRSHQIAAELSKYEIHTDSIQRALFANWTLEKMSFLSKLINEAKHFKNEKIVGLIIRKADLEKFHLQGDDVNDLLDLFTLVKSVELCYCIREISHDHYKLSFRSIGSNQAFELAERFSGGGHGTSSGAWVKSDLASIEQKIMNFLQL